MHECTTIKAEHDAKLIAIIKAQTQHFATNKFHISEGNVREVGHSQVAGIEFAIDEQTIHHVYFREVTIVEGASFVLSSFKLYI